MHGARLLRTALTEALERACCQRLIRCPVSSAFSLDEVLGGLYVAAQSTKTPNAIGKSRNVLTKNAPTRCAFRRELVPAFDLFDRKFDRFYQ